MRAGSPFPSPDEKLLERIAEALGVPAEAFLVMPAELVFHTDVDGARWLLANGAPGSPTVRRLSAHASERASTEESVAVFLARNLDNPKGKALAVLIDRVLSMHLHLDMRG